MQDQTPIGMPEITPSAKLFAAETRIYWEIFTAASVTGLYLIYR
jgi:hypothetical protein